MPVVKDRPYPAVDLGAGSGRAMLGNLSEDRLELREIYRFDNRILHLGEHLHWDFDALVTEIETALRRCAETGVRDSGP